MNRRNFLDLLIAASIETASCQSQTLKIHERLTSLARHEELAILLLDVTGVDLNSGKTARLALPRMTPARAVSPDGEWIAWIPEEAYIFPHVGGQPTISISTDAHTTRSIGYPGRFCEGLAISSNASKLAVLAVNAQPDHTLMEIDVESGEQHDLSAFATAFRPADIRRLSLSGDGDRLAFGTRENFALLDLASRKVILESSGRFPTLSPDGNNLAWVQDGRLMIRNLEAETTRGYFEQLRVDGVGAWSPNGELLLAGVRTSALAQRKLAAVDIVNNEIEETQGLYEGDYGNLCAWIKRRFLSL